MARHVFGPKNVLSGTALAVTTIGEESHCQYVDTVTYDISWGNGVALNAGLTIQKYNGIDWVNLDLASPISMGGASGAETVIITKVNFPKIRPVITFIAGSCNISVVANGTTEGA